MVDLGKLDPAETAQHLGKPEGEIGRALADSMAERNWPVYEAAIRRVGVEPGEGLLEIGFGNGKLVPRLLALAPGAGPLRPACEAANRLRSPNEARRKICQKPSVSVLAVWLAISNPT